MGSMSTKPKEYAVSVHAAQLIDVPSPCCSACNAVATIVESTDIISSARATMANTSGRRSGWLTSSRLR
jgi:hypothetical protein